MPDPGDGKSCPLSLDLGFWNSQSWFVVAQLKEEYYAHSFVTHIE